MNEEQDPLEAELAAFRPRGLSDASRRRIAGRLADPTPRRLRWLGTIALAGGLAAACLAAVFRGWSGDGAGESGPAIVGRPTATLDRSDDVLPTLRAYREVLARSPEDLDALLDRHAVHASGPDPRLSRIRAFTRPDLEVREFSGEL